jgi:hypothetical protein
MNTGTRWAIGLLLAVVIGLAVGLAIVTGDNGDDEPTTTLETEVEETEPTETEVEPDVTETVPTEGGVAPPTTPKPDGTGGLGAE